MWSSIGSAGFIDPAASNNVFMFGSVVQLGVGVGGIVQAPTRGTARISLPTLTANIRYPVLPDEELAEGTLEFLALRLRFRPGNGHIRATLIRVPMQFGGGDINLDDHLLDEQPLLVWDSSLAQPAVPGFQSWELANLAPGADPNFMLDPPSNVYYIDLSLTAPEFFIGTPPAVAAIQLIRRFEV